MARTSNRKRKASKGKEESLNHSISNKGVKKLFKKKLSRKIDETIKSKVAQSTSRQELVSVPTHASVTTSLPLYNDRKKHEDTVEKKHASGFVFMCNGKTKSECYQFRVFGLPKGKIEVVKNISSDMKLFLFDTNLRLLYGIYQATSEGALDLEPTAFNGQFQAQVKFKIFKECLPLPESDFKHAIEDNYDSRRKFRQELSSEQVKSLISLFRPFAKKRPSAKKSRVHGNVASQPSFRSTQTNKVVRSYPLENLSSGVHYLPILETRPEHDVHHGQYDPFESGLHVSHSQVQPGIVRVEYPSRHVEAYHPEHAHEGYFLEKSLRYPPDSYESFRPTIEANDNGDHRDGRQYHASQSLSSRDVTLKDYYAPGYYSKRLSPTTTHTAPLSQARSSPYHVSQSLSSRDVPLVDYYAPGYYSERLPPTTTHTAPLSQVRLSPYHASQSLSSRDVPLVDYYAPGYYSKRLPPTTTHTAPLSQARLSPYHASQSLSSRDVPLVDYYAPGYYSKRLPPTTHTAPLSQARLSPYHASQSLSSRDVPLVDYYAPGYYSKRLPPTTHTAPLSQARSSPYRRPNRLPSPYHRENRLHSPYHSQNRLPSPHRSLNRLPSPHRSYYSAVAFEDRGRVYSLPQGRPASGNLSYGESNLPISSCYSSAATRVSYR